MTAQEYAAGLRAVADWYEQNPEAPLPWDPAIRIPADDTAEAARAVARMLGRADKKFTESMFVLARQFGAVALEFVFWRQAVCTRRVVGTKTVPAVPARPAREEEIIEWDCAPIFEDKDA